MNIAILGAGFIARFYLMSLSAQRIKDEVVMLYGRSKEKAAALANEFAVAAVTDDMEAAITHPSVDVVVIALPNNLHLPAVLACAKAGKHVLCTKPLGRTAAEALTMLQAIENAGIIGGYLEDLCYTPKYLKAVQAVQNGALGEIIWAKSRETHPGPHSDWFWDKEKAGGGAIVDLGCHCIAISRGFIGKNCKPVSVMCWADTRVHPIDAEDNAIGLVKYENGAIAQFEVSWSFRGGMDLRDEVMGTEGTLWLNHFLRTGFDMFTSGQQQNYIAEKAESDKGWLFPVGDEVHELGYNHMFTNMFQAIEKGTQPQETFYDGYIVNAIIDAAYASAQTGQWEPVLLPHWRAPAQEPVQPSYPSYDAAYYLIKEETLPSGEKKYIVKNKKTGSIEKR